MYYLTHLKSCFADRSLTLNWRNPRACIDHVFKENTFFMYLIDKYYKLTCLSNAASAALRSVCGPHVSPRPARHRRELSARGQQKIRRSAETDSRASSFSAVSYKCKHLTPSTPEWFILLFASCLQPFLCYQASPVICSLSSTVVFRVPGFLLLSLLDGEFYLHS